VLLQQRPCASADNINAFSGFLREVSPDEIKVLDGRKQDGDRLLQPAEVNTSESNSQPSIQCRQKEGDTKGWSTVLVTALGSWEKTVPRGHLIMPS
jgi:hypothetical protein